jgi:transposase InsO family protein
MQVPAHELDDELSPQIRRRMVGRASNVQHSREIKNAAVVELCTGTTNAQSIAQSVGVCRPTLYNWKNQLLGREVSAVYLSPVIDCFDGLVVSWTIGTRPDSDLVNTMLDAAIETVAASANRPVFILTVALTTAGQVGLNGYTMPSLFVRCLAKDARQTMLHAKAFSVD